MEIRYRAEGKARLYVFFMDFGIRFIQSLEIVYNPRLQALTNRSAARSCIIERRIEKHRGLRVCRADSRLEMGEVGDWLLGGSRMHGIRETDDWVDSSGRFPVRFGQACRWERHWRCWFSAGETRELRYCAFWDKVKLVSHALFRS